MIQVPTIVKRAAPFLGVQGFMVTKFAATHNVDAAAQDLVANYMMTPSAQTLLAAANNRFPANMVAGKAVKDPYLAQFGKASVGGVPMPNIPQMDSVWSDLGGAWVKSTKGAGATKASVAFRAASQVDRQQDRLVGSATKQAQCGRRSTRRPHSLRTGPSCDS